MKEVTLIAVDLAKEKFQLHGCDKNGNAIFRKQLNRKEFAKSMVNIRPCRIAMESCASSQYWARKFQSQGHEVRLISPKFVKPFVKSQKNDRNDAEAIAEAAVRPGMRFVGIKTVAQQDIQSMHKSRDLVIATRIALVNHIRALLFEYGIAIDEGYANFKKQLPFILEDGANELTATVRIIIDQTSKSIDGLDATQKMYDQKLKASAKENDDCSRLMKIPGVGPMIATHFVSAIADPSVFKNGRQCAAWLGLVPRQSSSGGKSILGGITKRGDKDLRRIMFEGASTILICARRYQRKDPWSLWALKLWEQKGYAKAVVAMENKLCRTMWHVLATKEEFKMH